MIFREKIIKNYSDPDKTLENPNNFLNETGCLNNKIPT